jgi:hypothetical protein
MGADGGFTTAGAATDFLLCFDFFFGWTVDEATSGTLGLRFGFQNRATVSVKITTTRITEKGAEVFFELVTLSRITNYFDWARLSCRRPRLIEQIYRKIRIIEYTKLKNILILVIFNDHFEI